MPLALPRLSSAVPRTVVPGDMAAANAPVSRFLIDAQVFDEADLPDAWGDSLQACQQALAACIRREIGPLHCLNPGFGLNAVDTQGYAISRHRFANGKPETYREVEIYWYETGEQEWPIGLGLQALESALPDLGRAVLQVLREQCARVYPLFTPDVACEVASMLYWYGEENEEIALDMYCGKDEQERQAMRSQMLTRAMLDEAYPEWARGWMKERSRRCRLHHAAQTITDPRLRQIVADAQALSQLQCDDSFRPDAEGEYIGFGAVLSWEEGDVTTRIHDDLIQMAYQGEFCDRMGELRIPLDDPGALGAWFHAMWPRLKAIGLIDRLIHQLTM